MSETAYDGKPLKKGDTVYEVHPYGMVVSEILPKDEACHGIFTVKVEDSDDEYKPSALTHEPFYRFPPMAKLSEWTIEQQLEKIREESVEIDEAYDEIKRISQYTAPEDIQYRRMNFGMEIMDRIHCDETLLRKVFTPEEAVELWKAVEKKNRARMYYQKE